VISPYALPRGVTDPAGRNGFVTNADGGVTALDLRSGSVLWETKMARRPVLVAGERVYASIFDQPGKLRIVGLDIRRHGVVTFESDTVSLSGATSGHATTLRWLPDANQVRLTLDPADGSPNERGFVIDLRTGSVQQMPPAPPSLDNMLPRLDNRAVRWQGTVGNSHKVLALEETPVEQQLVLHAWNRTTGVAETPHVLFSGKRLVVCATVNSQFLCIRDAMPSPEQRADDLTRFAWSIFDVATGALVARMPYQAGTQAISVIGSRAYCLVSDGVPTAFRGPFVSPHKLKAIDLRSGKSVWERPVEGKRVVPVGT
jgi:hypothetical protein